MDSLIDYIQWMGNYPFSATGFREADALILCAISYFDLSPVFEASNSARVRDCSAMLAADRARVMVTGKNDEFEHVLALAAASRRFGELHMTDYVDVFREDPPLQFSAVCFHDDDGLSFLAYRGTDSSLAGWEEDFLIGCTRTTAQALALRYALDRITPGRRWMLGGHSKGGNHVLYTACSLPEDLWDLVERVFILDGPGLCPEVMDLSSVDRVNPKATRIIPYFSVVGKLFEPKISDTRIVRSFAQGMMQHCLISWGIDHGDLALATENDPRSLWLNETINNWIGNISQEDRPVFIRDLFDALSANGAVTLEELDDQGRAGFETIIRRLWESSPVTRRVIGDLPRQFVKNSVESFWRKKETESRNRETKAEEDSAAANQGDRA